MKHDSVVWLEFFDDLMMAASIRSLDIFNDANILNVPCHVADVDAYIARALSL